MRFRLGRSLRLIIGLAFLVFMVPFLMSKLDSSNNRSTTEDKEVDYPDVRIQKQIRFLLTLFIDHFFGIYRSREKPEIFQLNRKVVVYNQ